MNQNSKDLDNAKTRLRGVLKHYDLKTLVFHLTQERPQTCALLISVLSEETRAQVMAELPANVAAEITQRLAGLGTVLPMAIELLAESYEKQLALRR